VKVLQPPLPYGFSALEPALSAESVRLHYEEHQGGYIRRLNAIDEVEEIPTEISIERLMLIGAKQDAPVDPFEIPQKPVASHLFDMAAQVWNHTFFFNSLHPEGGGMPSGDIADAIRINYGTFERFRETARSRALSIFGSGWLWICMKGDALYTIDGRNAATPIVYGMTPILTIDMWEHAYYLDYHNDRGAYFDAVMDDLINWEFANDNVKRAPY
jgi:Fe-Mn family superoxide dismutase